jgi:riboflavin kinase/FMN adenylyltransferase
MRLEVVPPLRIGGRVVSSTETRGLISSGEVYEAARLLGRFYRMTGTVVRGAERGRTIGFPTANLAEIATLLPPDGVYAGRAEVEGETWGAAIHIGSNPTFADRQQKVEVHLLDYQGELYGNTLAVEFVSRIRGTVCFPGVEALVEQLRRDIEQARALAKEELPG